MTTISKKLDLKKITEKKSTWVMKILSGVHIGGEIQLGWQTYKLGSNSKNDIILQDRDIAEHHMDVEIASEGDDGVVYITPKQGKVELNGEAIDKKTKLKNFDLISAGSTFFVIGRSNAKWPQIMVLSLLNKNKTDSGNVTEDEKKATGADQAQTTKIEQPTDQGHALFWLATFLIFTAFGILSYMGIDWYYEGEREEMRMMKMKEYYDEALELAKDWIEKYPKIELVLVSDRQSRLITVTGYVPSRKYLIELENLLPDHLDVKILPHIYVVKDMLEQTISIIKDFNFDLEAYYGGNGSIILSGVLLHIKHFHDLENKLYEYINGLKSLQNKVLLIDDLKLEIKAVVILPHKRYIVTEENKIFQEGSFVNDNIKLKSILHEHLILEKNNLEILFDFRKKIVRRAPSKISDIEMPVTDSTENVLNLNPR